MMELSAPSFDLYQNGNCFSLPSPFLTLSFFLSSLFQEIEKKDPESKKNLISRYKIQTCALIGSEFFVDNMTIFDLIRLNPLVQASITASQDEKYK